MNSKLGFRLLLRAGSSDAFRHPGTTIAAVPPAAGDKIRVGGELPINPDGGAIGQGRFVMTRLVEGVRQIRGTSSNQVANADNVLIASGAGGPADGIILRKN